MNATISLPRAALELRSVRVQRRARVVLEDLNVQVVPGELLFVVGPNGSGKSTLLDACLGLIPCSAGTIEYAGHALKALSPQDRTSYVGLVGREQTSTLPLTVADLLAMGRALGQRSGRSWDDAQFARWISKDLAARPLADLSFGERQRIHLTRGFLQGPHVLLWDEATAHLDLAHREEAFRMARGFAARGGAMVIVVHELELALRFADRVMVVAGGKLRALGPPRTVFTRDLLRDVFHVSAEVHATQSYLTWDTYA